LRSRNPICIRALKYPERRAYSSELDSVGEAGSYFGERGRYRTSKGSHRRRSPQSDDRCHESILNKILAGLITHKASKDTFGTIDKFALHHRRSPLTVTAIPEEMLEAARGNVNYLLVHAQRE
jgi:hypothetical protein